MPNERELLRELIGKLETSLATIPVALSLISDESAESKTKESLARVNASVKKLEEVVDGVRFIMSYLVFDLEATRRERDHMRGLLEDKDQ